MQDTDSEDKARQQSQTGTPYWSVPPLGLVIIGYKYLARD